MSSKVNWRAGPEAPGTPAFHNSQSATIDGQVGETRVEFALAFPDRFTTVAEASPALTWKVNAASFQELRAHPAVAGVLVETRRLELKEDRRWKRRS